ncbi:PDZ domain-containing protein [Microbacteriaceae bacterium VKM Ac-2855]|nr:PDZ domain-containing protein [Microbacteriaceae bacterium VKM Ac-2855]
MTLFRDDAPRPVRRSRRRLVGPAILGVGVALVLILGVTPAPYVIEQPGPVYDTLGSSEHDGEETPLISIPDETTYPTAGSLDMLTVSVVGNPENLPNWVEIASAWFDSSKAVVPVESIFPASTTTEERDQVNQAEMVDSQQEAIAAALTELGYDVGSAVTISQVLDGSPATGILQLDDVIEAVNGTAVADVDALRAALADNGASAPATLTILRGGVEQSVQVTPQLSDDAVVIGIGAGISFDFPFDVQIQLDDVGGPSAGMMFALGIIDKLTDGELNGGENIAGTGTIDSTGTVGAIGGIRQKLFGARDAGATYFLAPESNCNEVVGHVPSGITVFAVSTLDDSLDALAAISAGDTSELANCDAATPLN